MSRLVLSLAFVFYLLSVTAVTSHDDGLTPASVSDATLGHSFRNHVMPVLTKMGCNSGPCHGAAAGKNGFALSLRGYDPEADYDTLTKQAAGRRVNQQEPARSLLLLKPTETVPHMGGKRFERDSPEYRVLASWIAAGAPRPAASDPTLVRLEVLPPRQRADVGTHLDLRVIAHYSGGTAEDVTRWARYSTTDESVAQVDTHGAVAVKGHGEASINVAFLTSLASARVTSAFPNDVPEAAFDKVPQDTLIDRLVVQKLRDLHIAPSPPASDVTFIRRAYLDAAGILPSAEDIEQFVNDPAPDQDKRTRLIDRLLSRPEFIDYWTYQWSDLLLVSSNSLGPNNLQAFYDWIRTSVADNKPWDRFAYEITTAVGRSTGVGPVNFYLIHKSQTDLTESFAQAFLGLSLTCARCHNHPLESWTQRDYYAFANLFSRIAVKSEDSRFGKYDATLVVSTPDGDIRHPRTGEVLPPTPLGGTPMPSHDRDDRRVYLARWLTSPDNVLFARTIVNRVWGHFLGRGLVDPVDDLRATNPASNEELLDAIAQDFTAHHYDVKRLMRQIMESAAYQRSSEPNAANAQDDRYYSRYFVRRLPAEVILDAVSQVTGVPESYEGYPEGTRAMQLRDVKVSSYFLDTFGRPKRVLTSASERMQDSNLTQALHVVNGDTLNKKLQSPDSIVSKLAREGATDEQVIVQLYGTVFGRKPSDAERSLVMSTLSAAPPRNNDGGDKSKERQRAIEDVLWAMLTSKEFLFNH